MLEISNEVNLVKEIKNLKIKTIFAAMISLGIPIVLLIAMFSILILQVVTEFSLGSVIIPTLNLFVQGNLWYGRRYKKSLDEKMKGFAHEISEKTNSTCAIYDLNDIEIVPKNIKLGEDLSHKNIIEIFQKGHYVLVHAFPEDVVIRQYVDDNEELHVDLLQDEEREAALTELYTPKDEGVKRLTLNTRDSK